jgi:hypothetical protein
MELGQATLLRRCSTTHGKPLKFHLEDFEKHVVPLRFCCNCRQFLDLSQFYTNRYRKFRGKNKLRSECKKCENAKRAERNRRNRRT